MKINKNPKNQKDLQTLQNKQSTHNHQESLLNKTQNIVDNQTQIDKKSTFKASPSVKTPPTINPSVKKNNKIFI